MGQKEKIRIQVFHLLELNGLTAQEVRVVEKIRMGLSDSMQEVFDGDHLHLRYHHVASVEVDDAEHAVEVTLHGECDWQHNVEVVEYFPTQLPTRSTRIGDVLKIGIHYMGITKLNEDGLPPRQFPTTSFGTPVQPIVTVKQRRATFPPADNHVWRPSI